VTESDALARALDAASQRWPGTSRPQLLVRLALEGDRVLNEAAQQRRSERLAALERHAGALTGVFGDGYLDRLRRDWPA
jgi:hypothetical protein